jgi:hypothetical protein
MDPSEEEICPHDFGDRFVFSVGFVERSQNPSRVQSLGQLGVDLFRAQRLLAADRRPHHVRRPARHASRISTGRADL